MSWINRVWVKHLDKRILKYKDIREKMTRWIKRDRKLRQEYWSLLTTDERMDIGCEMCGLPPVPKPPRGKK